MIIFTHHQNSSWFSSSIRISVTPPIVRHRRLLQPNVCGWWCSKICRWFAPLSSTSSQWRAIIIIVTSPGWCAVVLIGRWLKFHHCRAFGLTTLLPGSQDVHNLISSGDCLNTQYTHRVKCANNWSELQYPTPASQFADGWSLSSSLIGASSERLDHWRTWVRLQSVSLEWQ